MGGYTQMRPIRLAAQMSGPPFFLKLIAAVARIIAQNPQAELYQLVDYLFNEVRRSELHVNDA